MVDLEKSNRSDRLFAAVLRLYGLPGEINEDSSIEYSHDGGLSGERIGSWQRI